MPTKPFYSLDEVCQKLGKTADQIKALVRDGVLREFRDAGKVFFKADDIEKLSAGSGAGDVLAGDSGEILLEPAVDDSKGSAADLTPLSDTSGGTSIIGLEPVAEEQEEQKEDTVVTAGGVGVFDEDEIEVDTDPMAKTQITTGATADQVSLEGAGSGSGLLDLAREADDTALGADLLDEIYPGEEAGEEKKGSAAPVAAAPAAAAAAEPEAEVLEEAESTGVMVPTAVVAVDAAEGLFSGLLVGALAVMALASTVVAGAVQGYLPDFGRFLGEGAKFYMLLGGSVVGLTLGAVVGWLLSRALSTRRR